MIKIPTFEGSSWTGLTTSLIGHIKERPGLSQDEIFLLIAYVEELQKHFQFMEKEQRIETPSSVLEKEIAELRASLEQTAGHYERQIEDLKEEFDYDIKELKAENDSYQKKLVQLTHEKRDADKLVFLQSDFMLRKKREYEEYLD